MKEKREEKKKKTFFKNVVVVVVVVVTKNFSLSFLSPYTRTASFEDEERETERVSQKTTKRETTKGKKGVAFALFF